MSQEVQPAALSVQKAAIYLGLSDRSIYKLLEAEKIEAKKEGRKTLVLRQSLDRYLAELPAFGKVA
jgi:excisionase family DNA binding protein